MRKINWNPNEQIIEPEAHAPASPPPVRAVVQTTPTQSTVIQTRVRVRNGNGHRSEMVRKLNDSERAWLKNRFLQKNGQIANDDCVAFKGQIISESIAIFQITGYISVLHRYVAMGRLELRDLTAYLGWMHEKYHGLWVQYNNQRFTAVRRANQAARSREQAPPEITAGPLSTTPSFKAFGKRRAYCTPTS